MSFKKNYERLCFEKRMKPSAVCEAIGLARSTYSLWNDNSIPRQATLKKLADYLGVSVDDLLGRNEDTEEEEPPKQTGVRIPVLGRVAAGIPIEAIQDIDDWEEIPKKMAAGGTYYALRIHGRSMEPRMREGDIVIVRQQEQVDNGEIAVVIVNGFEATCKKVEFFDGGIRLVSLNEEYAPMTFTFDEVNRLPVHIIGKVVELRAKF